MTKTYFLHSSSEISTDSKIGKNSKIWHYSHIFGESIIGEDCVIGQNVMIGPNVTIGNRCKIQNNVSLYKGIILEDNVFCGPSCVFTNVNNPRAEIERKEEFAPTLVKRGSSIGANATIICGSTLGEYCFIAAGAVVAKDVPPHALMAGVPAKRVGWMSHAGRKLDETMTCPDTNQKYAERNGNLIEIK